jgi:hypothetical protein
MVKKLKRSAIQWRCFGNAAGGRSLKCGDQNSSSSFSR